MTQPDPFITAKFWVEINGIAIGSFMECSGLNVQTDADPVKEGGLNDYVHMLPTRSKWGNVTLKRGWLATDDLWKWYLKIVKGQIEKKNVTILAFPNKGTSTGQPAFSWLLANAFPVKWTGPDFKADAASVAVESIELAHTGWEVSKG